MIPSLKSSWFTSVPSLPEPTSGFPHTALSGAALKSSVLLASSSKFTSPDTFIFRAWISMICARASSFGCGNSILRPGARPQQRGVQDVGSVGGGDDLHAVVRREPVELIQELEHRPLHLAVAVRVRVETLRADGVDLVNEDDRGRLFLRQRERSRTNLAPSPMNICTSRGPASFRYAVGLRRARARDGVFLIPGGP